MAQKDGYQIDEHSLKFSAKFAAGKNCPQQNEAIFGGQI